MFEKDSMNNHKFKKGDLVTIKGNLDPNYVAIFIEYEPKMGVTQSINSAHIIWSNGKSEIWLADILQLVTRANEK